MFKTTLMSIFAVLLLLLVLSGCNSKSEAEVLQEAEEIAGETFESTESIEVNKELDHLSLYLPKNIEVKEADANNIILNDGKQTFIIFYNNLEAPTSDLNYQTSQSNSKDQLLLKSFEDPDKFGYIQVLPGKEGEYELQIGVGGVKITTITTRAKMVHHTTELMKIARSIVEANINE